MITYHQAFDIYHTIYRIIKIIQENDFQKIERDRLRIFDFYMLFPQDFKNVKLPSAGRYLRSTYKETRYNSLPDRKRVFYQIGKYFETSLQCLLSYEILDFESYSKDEIWIKNIEKIQEILNVTNNPIDSEVLRSLSSVFLNMPIIELKERTGLIEYRYDILKS